MKYYTDKLLKEMYPDPKGVRLLNFMIALYVSAGIFAIGCLFAVLLVYFGVM